VKLKNFPDLDEEHETSRHSLRRPSSLQKSPRVIQDPKFRAFVTINNLSHTVFDELFTEINQREKIFLKDPLNRFFFKHISNSIIHFYDSRKIFNIRLVDTEN